MTFEQLRATTIHILSINAKLLDAYERLAKNRTDTDADRLCEERDDMKAALLSEAQAIVEQLHRIPRMAARWNTLHPDERALSGDDDFLFAIRARRAAERALKTGENNR